MKCAMSCRGASRLLAASALLALALALPAHSQGNLHKCLSSHDKAEHLHLLAVVPYQSAFGWSTCLTDTPRSLRWACKSNAGVHSTSMRAGD